MGPPLHGLSIASQSFSTGKTVDFMTKFLAAHLQHNAPSQASLEMAPSIARTAALLLCAGGLEATYAFSPLSLAGAGTGSPAVRISSKCPAPMAAAPLPQLRKSNMILRATAKETSTTNVIQSTDENSLTNRVAAAKPGDTIELEKVRQ